MLNKMSIKLQLTLLVFITAISLILISGNQIYTDYNLKKNYQGLEKAVVLATKISALVHETQKERGATAGYIGAKGKKYKNMLFKQRKLTDKRLSLLKSYLSTIDLKSINLMMYNSVSKALDKLKNLSNVRNKVDTLSISLSQAIFYYSNINEILLNSVSMISTTSHSPRITQEIFAYTNFLLAKERAGIERAVGANTLARGTFADGMYVKLNNLISAQRSYLENFLRYASKDAKEFYRKTMQDSSVKEVNRIRGVLLESHKKKLIISHLKEIVGYGGFIHNFKNYVIRGRDKYSKRAAFNYEKAMKLIDEYKRLKYVSKREIELLDTIKSVFTKYKRGLSEVVQANENGMSVKELDKIVKVNDTPAIKALNELSNSFFTNSSKYWFKEMTQKINLLKKVDDFLAKELIISIGDEIKKANDKLIFSVTFDLGIVIFILLIAKFIVSNIELSLNKFQQGLLSFFKYLNKESSTAELIELKGKNEIAQMAKIVNENIDKTKRLLEQDRVLILDVKNIAEKVKNGFIRQEILSSTPNQELEELKNIFNDMISTIANKVCDDINVLHEALESYQNFDFTYRIPNPKGETAKGLNHLAQIIREILKANSSNGYVLNNSADILKNDIGSLVNVSDRIVKLLESTAVLTNEATNGLHESSEQSLEVNERANEIKSVVRVIQDIADQTNLLALNAAIEAARAGEHGRGFAVVADEVRKLAERTQKSLAEVNSTIQILAQSVSEVVENISKRVEEINKINSSMGSIEAVSKENVEVAQKIEKVAKDITGIAKTIEEEIKDKKF